MIARRTCLAGLAAAASLVGGSANAYPVTGINISLPEGPPVLVAHSDADGNFTGKVTVAKGEYTVSVACRGRSGCDAMRISALSVDGRAVRPSRDGVYRVAIGSRQRPVSFQGRVAPSEARGR
jgi:hypothetical protein